MDRPTPWHAVDAANQPDAGSQPAPAEQTRTDPLRLILAGLLGLVLLVAVAAVLWASTPQPQVIVGPGVESADPADEALPPGDRQPAAASELLVDVQGAVVQPGLQRVPAGSRVGDAISAAGGYSPQLDIRAAAARLNLAEPLLDGAKVHVPARGDPTPGPAAGGPAPGGGPGGASAGPATGLIDVNTAGQAQLETLPGIGPVTAGKIIAAREEAPFATVDELLSRKVVGPATFEKIRPLISVGP